jgi:hypothetical protein
MKSSKNSRSSLPILSWVLIWAGLLLWHSRAGGEPAGSEVQTGPNVSFQGRRFFPDDDVWNRDISKDPVDANSAALIAGIGADRPLHPDFGPARGIPYVVVPGDQPKVMVRFAYVGESDPGPYPIPPDAPIEGGPGSAGDRHVLVVDRDHWKLYELWTSVAQDNGAWWTAGSGAIWDLSRHSDRRPKGWTSADAAGLPILPGLVRYDEVATQKAIRHALRFTVRRTRHAYVFPASHFASNLFGANLPPMGMRVRLKADYDTSGFSENCQVILRALKTYGMILADGGSDWFISGAPNPGWDDDELHQLTWVKGGDLEVIQMGQIHTR